jgi:hypothetical protein
MALGRVIVAGACAGAIALAAAGCGAQEHANEPRPAPATRLSVAISNDSLTVTPPRIAFGPEERGTIPQNKGQPQPPIKTDEPLDIIFVSANLTDTSSKLVLHGPKDVSSGPLVANGNGLFQTALPTGSYTVSAAGMPEVKPAKLVVGPYRASSENSVLLP